MKPIRNWTSTSIFKTQHYIIAQLNNICYQGVRMKHPKFEFYTRPNGRTEFIEFLQTLPTKDRLNS